MSRIVAIDFGLKRTGIAVTDPLKIIASGLQTVHPKELIPFLQKYHQEETIELLVIGYPKNLDNTEVELETSIQKFIEQLGIHLPKIPITRVDERFTSKMAVQSMIASGVKKKDRKNKALVDEISATIILQSYLQHHY